MQERMHAQNVQNASLLVMRSQGQFSKDEEDIQSPLARTGSPGNTTWEFINLMLTCLLYLSSERKERLPARKMASNVIGHLDLP